MKRKLRDWISFFLLTALLCSLAGTGFAAEAPKTEDGLAAWTVMFYLCGSDLESKYGYATGNLEEIAQCQYHTSILGEIAREYGDKVDDTDVQQPEQVNVLIQTGGSKAWRARGLSFCYAVDYDIEALDAYARACPSPHYLAFLDAISPWTAPDWVFETVERLPEMDTIDEYTVTVEKHVQDNGTPSFSFTEGSATGVDVVHYQVYRCNEDTGMTVSLGVFPPYVDDNVYFVDAPVWPTVEGELCHVEVTSMGRNGYSEYLLNVPIQIGSEVWYLRCSYSVEAEAYTVYGLWEGFDSDSTLFNRNVKQLSQMAGQQYRLLYPVDGIEDGRTRYESSQKLTMYRSLEITDLPLPAGRYEIQFIVYDLFMRPMKLERVEVNWDGQTLSFPADMEWEGIETLQVDDSYWTD